ncbi:hypothetical protein K7I13_09885 [Brucepastera parasyntrophica]|uniref:hypothetical protein n=1 Tax=Brucepastera parasyntrophica TaxID=2880008 RepID=UPI00210D51F3|nr:hypothetical protein [Brucepastera parasyntrophica]ULQ58842.1 hypothetical protein K7I13_09885 [Brucepastera parasyntrophica]
MKNIRVLPLLLLCISLGGMVYAETNSMIMDGTDKSGSRFNPLFPYALTWKGAAEMAELRAASLVSVPTYEEFVERNKESPRLQSVLLNNDIFALYGKPGARTMGILGQYPIDEIENIMNDFVRVYDVANGRRGIIPAFYIIFGTCWPEGDIGITPDRVIKQYIEFAQARGWYVFLDHQIGKYTVESSMEKMLPYLKYSNVHLALDPEWRTTKPMQEIGSVSGEEINTAQKMMQDYLVEHGLPGRRMLVVHQFKPKMIANRPAIKTDFELVQLIHCADGIGSPALKKNSYAANAYAENMPLKSFKLFLEPKVEGAIYDQPLMTPEEVLSLDPRPYLIMYQ